MAHIAENNDHNIDPPFGKFRTRVLYVILL
jgi:hypothetical protein